ncbi:16S rRNA (cytosine(967)-C(5))-methyltransferase RsmB [Romboutsia sp. Marseille-P6047]|uniref:16S rRNA (cytosine(967)-C(5))-methyltransferase RsmB n=1 Tax=Romboutsia sp. Marseille-P6047 TaxID=2161817 RepID=UPI000F06E6E0|nr:16S rRNA (cytosine(967)-C(5))-methyltransferase RsmB [Romboutsia sp. Marseille-P6047]
MKSRELALKVLLDIEENNNYSNIAINKHFKNINMNNQDRGLATELIYGVVENKYYLDYIIDKLSKIKCKKMNIYVKILLRMGIYQILLLDSISDYAAVNETVSLVKKYDKRSSGFVNAILRNVIRQKDTIGEVDIKDDTIMYLSTRYSYKPWMIKNWINNFSKEFTEDLLEANNEKPSVYLRTNTLKITRDELIEKLINEGVVCSKVPMVEEAIKVENLKNIENNQLFKDGLFTIQDISSMIVGKVMNPKENSLVLDVCSAPGGKTTHLATLMNNTGQVISRDIFEHKLKLIQSTVDRLGLTNVDVQSFDASILDESSVDKFDYVLADVPCSGLGIIRRKPEIKYKEKAELKGLPDIQKTILNNASKYVKIGGTLVYSTCTIQDNENIDIINDFLANNSNFTLVPIGEVKVDLDNQENGYLKIYPNIHDIDGFFIAKLKRVR